MFKFDFYDFVFLSHKGNLSDTDVRRYSLMAVHFELAPPFYTKEPSF